MSVKAYLRKNLAEGSKGYGKYYAYADNETPLTLDGLADHMSHHNTPFSKGTITGILKDMVSCIRELNLMGIPVKIDGLAIFSTHIENKGGWDTLADVNLSMGGESDNIQALRLCAQASGEFTKSELTKAGSVQLNRYWREQVQAAKKAGGDDTDPEPSGSGSSTQDSSQDSTQGGAQGGTQGGSTEPGADGDGN